MPVSMRSSSELEKFRRMVFSPAPFTKNGPPGTKATRSSAIARASSSLDRYTRQLHQLGLESSEREVKWLNELIAAERVATAGPTVPPSQGHADQT